MVTAGETITYSYDALGRLVSTTHSGSVNNGLQSRYVHDKADNRTNVAVSGAGRAGPAPGGTYVETATILYPGESIVSPDGRFRLVAQADGNLVLYQSGNVVLWHSETSGRSMRATVMQADGNLVVYDANNVASWSSQTQAAGTSLHMQSDGNVVIYRSGGVPIWSTNTGGR